MLNPIGVCGPCVHVKFPQKGLTSVTVLHMHANSKHLAFRESKAAVPALGLRVYMFVFCQCFCILPVKHLCLRDQQTRAGSVI